MDSVKILVFAVSLILMLDGYKAQGIFSSFHSYLSTINMWHILYVQEISKIFNVDY